MHDMQEVEYNVWSRSAERGLRLKAGPHRLSGVIPHFSMAFQPIVNVADREIFGYESLVRSKSGDSASSVLAQVPVNNYFLFDKACRSRGIELAMQLGLVKSGASLAVNINPHAAVAAHSHLHLTCCEAAEVGFPLDRLILEFVEDAEVRDPESLRALMREYQQMGVRIAIDDFGSGYSGLSLLASLRPDIVKLDMSLVSKVDRDHAAFIVVSAMVKACRELGVEIIAEGVENVSTMHALADMGVDLQQGFLFARPGFEVLPGVAFPENLAASA